MPILSLDAAVLGVLLLGLLPGYEPRYAVPLLACRLGVLPGLALSLAEVLVLASALALAVDRLWALFLSLARRYRVLGVLRDRVLRARGRAEGLVEKYGVVGLAFFVAVPLPVTGMYTGAAVALLLGLGRGKAFIALAVGGAASVLMVAAAVRVFAASLC